MSQYNTTRNPYKATAVTQNDHLGEGILQHTVQGQEGGEKDNGFAEHIRLATGATHDTEVQR